MSFLSEQDLALKEMQLTFFKWTFHGFKPSASEQPHLPQFSGPSLLLATNVLTSATTKSGATDKRRTCRRRRSNRPSARSGIRSKAASTRSKKSPETSSSRIRFPAATTTMTSRRQRRSRRSSCQSTSPRSSRAQKTETCRTSGSTSPSSSSRPTARWASY